jgi:hypothetical protein
MAHLTLNIQKGEEMKKKSIIVSSLGVLLVLAMLSGCATAPTASNFVSPKVTLSMVEVPYYTGYWYFGKKTEPTKGAAGDYGAPMQLAFIFDIENPNKYPVLMEELKFTVLFEDFEVNTVGSTETMWIPAGKTNQLRVPAMFDTRQTLLTLLLPGAMKLKEKGVSPWDLLEKWWNGAPEASFPIAVKEGAAVFKAGDLVDVVAFEGMFP